MKKIIAFAAALMICGAFTSCSGKNNDSKKKNPDAPVTTNNSSSGGDAVINVPAKPIEPAESETPTIDVSGVEFEESREAGSGDAFLAVIDDSWRIQYLGSKDDPLSYDAGIANITGNGEYTVSVNANTKGLRYAVNGDPDASCSPSGLSFMYVNIRDGESKFPGAVITVNSVKVNGNEVGLSAKPYTSSEDGVDTRATIFNNYAIEPSKDARGAEGALYKADGSKEEYASQYGAKVVNSDDFASWTTIEVTFTVSGLQ